MAKSPRKTTATKTDSTPVDQAGDLPNDRDSTTTEPATSLPMTRDGEPGIDHAVSGADPSNVEKQSVKTTGDFSLKDPFTGTDIPKGETVTVVVTSFITERLENGDLEKA